VQAQHDGETRLARAGIPGQRTSTCDTCDNRSMARIAFLLMLCACGGSQVSEKRQSAEAKRGEPAKACPTGLRCGFSEASCADDAAAKQACTNKGDAWQYSNPPPRDCSGVDRKTEPPAPPPTCECIEKAEYDRLLKECSEVP